MPVQETPNSRGARRGRMLASRLAGDLEAARVTGGLSIRELARRLRCDRDRVARALRGESSTLTVDFLARLAAVLGLELAMSLHPAGEPVRDKGHLALLERLRVRLGPLLRWRTEVAIPISGDRRSADAMITGPGFEILVEAETRLGDIQALERGLGGKQRDLEVKRVILLVADTRHNRKVLEGVGELRRRLPISTRACLAALARAHDPGGDAIVVL